MRPVLDLSFEDLTAMVFQVEVFWVVTSSSVVVGYQRFGGPLHPEDVGNMSLRNVSILPQNYTASQPRRPRLVHALVYSQTKSAERPNAILLSHSRLLPQ
jgi:hypothetical protein